MNNCKKCGKEIDDDEAFCQKCCKQIKRGNKIVITITLTAWLICMIGIALNIKIQSNLAKANENNKLVENEVVKNETKPKGKAITIYQKQSGDNVNSLTNDEIRKNYTPEEAVMYLGLGTSNLMEIYGVSYDYANYIEFWYSNYATEYNIEDGENIQQNDINNQ